MVSQPVHKKKRQPSSVWEIEQQFNKYSNAISRPVFEPLAKYGLDGWTHWPTPMNFQARITQLACEPTWQAKIEMYATGALWFFWTNVIPSPVEITRKLFLGGYKCGFYIPIRIKSPLNFFIGAGGTQFLAELAAPITRALWMWWVASSLFSALDIWQTVTMLEDECQTNGFNVLLANGGGAVNGSGSYQGAGMDVIQDEFLRAAGGSAVDVHNSIWTYNAFCSFNPMDNPIAYVDLQIKTGVTILAELRIDNPAGTNPLPMNLDAEGTMGDSGNVYAIMHWEFSGPWNLQYGQVLFSRCTGNGIPYVP